MKISGLQKLTALDYPGRIACTVFTPGCNFRCPFCHNAALVTQAQPDSMDEDEVFAYLRKRWGVLDGVVITGGEPLLQSGLEDFIRRVKELGYLVKLDTNGSLPKPLEALLKAGLLDYVAMDIKNSPGKYPLSCGADVDISAVDESVKLLMNSGVDYEFRTTVVAQLHSDEDFTAMGDWILGAKRWYLQNFVDSGGLISSGLSAAPKADMERFAELSRPFVENVEIRGI